jgi:hypothetical protein
MDRSSINQYTKILSRDILLVDGIRSLLNDVVTGYEFDIEAGRGVEVLCIVACPSIDFKRRLIRYGDRDLVTITVTEFGSLFSYLGAQQASSDIVQC